MTLLFVVVIIAIVAGVVILVARDRPVVDDDPADVRRLVWPPADGVGPADVEAARFTVALRGYRMDEVDRVLADVGVALAERDAQIAALESAPSLQVGSGEGAPLVPPSEAAASDDGDGAAAGGDRGADGDDAPNPDAAPADASAPADGSEVYRAAPPATDPSAPEPAVAESTPAAADPERA